MPSLLHPATQLLFLGFSQKERTFLLGHSHDKDCSVLILLCIMWNAVNYNSFNPTQKLNLRARGLGIPRGSADQVWGDLCCQAEMRGVKLSFYFSSDF